MIKPLLILIGLFLFAESFHYQGLYSGYNIAASRLADICYPSLGGICTTHGDPYIYLANTHVYLNWVLAVFIVSNILPEKLVSRVISILSLCFATVLLGYLYIFKTRYLLPELSYLELIRETIYVDLAHLWVLAVLLVLQMVHVFRQRRLSDVSGLNMIN